MPLKTINQLTHVKGKKYFYAKILSSWFMNDTQKKNCMWVPKPINATRSLVRHSASHMKTDAGIFMGNRKGITNESRGRTAGPQTPHSRWHTEETECLWCILKQDILKERLLPTSEQKFISPNSYIGFAEESLDSQDIQKSISSPF